ncbi:MAG: ribosome-associated translation inhibitor RaiA [Vicinamibacterales bacterium]|nr:ribosome-associated translation inhibitor RaiA [Vicinamibacterales bacterium]
MRVTLTGRQLDITPALEVLVNKRLAKIERRLNAAAVSAQVVLSREKNRCVVEVTVHAKQDHTLHGLGSSSSWSPALTAAVQKVVQQVERVKGKWQRRKRGASAARKGSRV